MSEFRIGGVSRYVLIHKFCSDSGYTEKAVRRKMEEGVWLEGREWRTAPDGHVVIDLANIAKALTAEEEPVPPGCGVYILFQDGAITYIGRSTRLKTRIGVHRRSGRVFDSVKIIACDEVTSIWLEPELIRILSPRDNLLRYKRRAAAFAKKLEAAKLA